LKLTDFGLWFYFYADRADRDMWSTTIHQQGSAFIFYDGVDLGCQYLDFDLIIYNKKPQRIKLKKDFPRQHDLRYRIGRPLTMDDFEIIPNPDYRGDP
jgi:hypothetical protein